MLQPAFCRKTVRDPWGKMSKLILLADDSPDDVLFFKRVLDIVGIINPVQVVGNGKEAMAYIKGEGSYADRQRFPAPSVLFLDLMMPAMNGWELLKWLSTQPETRNLIVIVMTGVEEQRHLQEAYGMGAHSFILKPLQAAEMKGLIDFWPERWMLMPPMGGSPGLPQTAPRPE